MKQSLEFHCMRRRICTISCCKTSKCCYLEVLLLNQQLIDSVIDSCKVALLDRYEVVLNQGQVVSLAQY